MLQAHKHTYAHTDTDTDTVAGRHVHISPHKPILTHTHTHTHTQTHTNTQLQDLMYESSRRHQHTTHTHTHHNPSLRGGGDNAKGQRKEWLSSVKLDVYGNLMLVCWVYVWDWAVVGYVAVSGWVGMKPSCADEPIKTKRDTV